MVDQQVQELTNKLANSQSRAFELISQLTGERDSLRNSLQTTQQNLTHAQSVINDVVAKLDMKTPKIEDMYAKIEDLMKRPASKGRKPSPKEV